MKSGNDLILDLPRPEYIAAPEVLISSMAWRVFAIEGGSEAELPLALAYRTDDRQSSTLNFQSSEPRGSKLDQWGEALQDSGVRTPDGAARTAMASAFAASIAGIRASRAKGQAATPLTPGLALLQNARGMMGKRNPPDVGRIIECVYALGSTPASYASPESASELWRSAAEAQIARTPLLNAVDRAAAATLLPGAPVSRTVTDLPKRRATDLGSETPFAWFADSWAALTSEDWVAALPARRWVDWATTVLRAGIAFGYLWEARYYEELARLIISSSGDGRVGQLWLNGVCKKVDTLIPWANQDEAVTVRDVSSRLKAYVRRGAHVRAVLREWLDASDGVEGSAAEVLGAMSKSSDVVEDLQSALASGGSAGGNTWEAIRYSLLTRERYGPYADYYGLLTTHGTRYLLVDPGTEWIAVVASLAAVHPGKETTVGAVRSSLRRLGLNPDVQELVSLLERAGMARGSADADEAVIVQSAY